jgi:hypothetical protein
MKIYKILYDAAKYPFSGLKQFFLLGLMILISSFLFSQYNDFYFFLDDFFGDVGLLLAILLFFIIVLLLTILEAGYTFNVIEKSLLGIKTPPKFNNFIHMFKHGLTEIIIGFIYFLIPAIIFLAILDDFFAEINIGMPALPDDTLILILIIGFLLGFIADVLFTVAIPHMAFKGGHFKQAFSFIEITRKIMRIGLKRLLIGYFFVILGVVVIGGPILKEIIESVNIIGFVIAQLVIAPYILMFYSRFVALIYRS